MLLFFLSGGDEKGEERKKGQVNKQRFPSRGHFLQTSSVSATAGRLGNYRARYLCFSPYFLFLFPSSSFYVIPSPLALLLFSSPSITSKSPSSFFSLLAFSQFSERERESATHTLRGRKKSLAKNFSPIYEKPALIFTVPIRIAVYFSRSPRRRPALVTIPSLFPPYFVSLRSVRKSPRGYKIHLLFSKLCLKLDQIEKSYLTNVSLCALLDIRTKAIVSMCFGCSRRGNCFFGKSARPGPKSRVFRLCKRKGKKKKKKKKKRQFI